MINLALKESKKSTARVKHGAVLVRGGSVLAKACNSYRTHPKWGGGPLRTLHAEAAVIRKAISRGIDPKGSVIYVARKNAQMSKPCPSCQAIIEEHGIRKVVYTDREGNVVTEWPL
jgi:deoxycytidylate deaminase